MRAILLVVATMASAACTSSEDASEDLHTIGACDPSWLMPPAGGCASACSTYSDSGEGSGAACAAKSGEALASCSHTSDHEGVTGCCAGIDDDGTGPDLKTEVFVECADQ